MKSRISSWAIAVLASITAVLVPQAASAQNYPSQPVHIIVPSTPGGALDILARIVAPDLSELWGQPVIVDNRPGAGGIVGTSAVTSASPDGYTLLIVTTGLTTNPFLYKSLPYDALKDLIPITIVASAPNVLVVNKDVPFRTLAEIIDAAKKQPGKLTYGSSGVGSSGQLSMAMVQQRTGVNLTHAPFKGAGAATQGVVSGEVQMLFTATGAALPFVKSGAVRPIIVTSLQRDPSMPDVPTAVESGLPNFENVGWYGIFSPARTPQPVVDKIYDGLAKVLAKPSVIKKIEEQGFAVGKITPQDFAPFIKAEIDKWGETIKAAGIKPE